MFNPWAAQVLQICGTTDKVQSFVFFKHMGRVQQRVTHGAGKSLLAEMTLPGKFTLGVSVLPAEQVNFSYQFKYFCSEMK